MERTIRAADFARWVEQQLREDTEVVRKAALDTALWGERHAAKLTNQVDAVDRGIFKNSWKHGSVKGGAELRNDAPYAGVIERGRRPGRPGPPLQPIIAWVNRKLGAQIKGQARFAKRLALGLAGTKGTRKARTEARKQVRETFGKGDNAAMAGVIARAIAIRDAIHVRGTKPRFILRDTLRAMRPRFQREALRRLRSRKR